MWTQMLPARGLAGSGHVTDVFPSVLPSGLCPDWETWDPSQPVENAREAMQQADDWLGVPQVRAHHTTTQCPLLPISPRRIINPDQSE